MKSDWEEICPNTYWKPRAGLVFESLVYPGSWCGQVIGKSVRYYATKETAMQALDAADKTEEPPALTDFMHPDVQAAARRAHGSYTDDNPKTQYGDKKPPVHLVPPALIVSAAGVFKLGARKYGAYNWREKTVSSSVYQGAAMRHLLAWWDGEEHDPESGESHLSHAAACLGILLDAQATGNLNDNRPPAGAASRLIAEAAEE